MNLIGKKKGAKGAAEDDEKQQAWIWTYEAKYYEKGLLVQDNHLYTIHEFNPSLNLNSKRLTPILSLIIASLSRISSQTYSLVHIQILLFRRSCSHQLFKYIFN